MDRKIVIEVEYDDWQLPGNNSDAKEDALLGDIFYLSSVRTVVRVDGWDSNSGPIKAEGTRRPKPGRIGAAKK